MKKLKSAGTGKIELNANDDSDDDDDNDSAQRSGEALLSQLLARDAASHDSDDVLNRLRGNLVSGVAMLRDLD